MKKLTLSVLLILLMIGSVNAQNQEIKVVEFEAIGRGDTLHKANINAYDKARYSVMAFEPTAVYTWLKSTNGSAQSKVVQVPAQIIGVDIVSTQVSVINQKENNTKIKFAGGIATEVGLDEFGNSKEGEYLVKTKFRFKLRGAQDVDRAKHLGEMQALRDIVSGKSIQAKNTFEEEGYGSVSKKLISMQAALLDKDSDKKSLIKLESFESISKGVKYFKDNLMAAIARSYPEPEMFEISRTEDRKGNQLLVLDIKLGEGCKLGDSSNPVGSLCDLWMQLPDQVLSAISRMGLANGNNIEKTPRDSLLRMRHFIENPLFYSHSDLLDSNARLLYFQKDNFINPFMFTDLEYSMPEEERHGGITQIAMPTSRSKNIAPLGHETMLNKLGIITASPDKRLVPGVTDAYSNAVLPDFFATAIIGKSPVTLTILNKKKKEYIDIPLTSDKFILTSRIDVALEDEELDYKKEDFGLVVWWGKHPVDNEWKKNNEQLSFPTLTRYVDAKMQMDILHFYRKNKASLEGNPAYKFVKQYPTSPGAFASLYFSCVLNKEDYCKYRVQSLYKTKVFVGKQDYSSHKLLSINKNPMDNKDNCWMYDRSETKMNKCEVTAKNARENWWLEIGANPLTLRKHVDKSDLWADLNKRTVDAPVLEHEYSNKVIQGSVTMPVTNPKTVW